VGDDKAIYPIQEKAVEKDIGHIESFKKEQAVKITDASLLGNPYNLLWELTNSLQTRMEDRTMGYVVYVSN
jgi:hypothetical protein